MLHAVDSDLPIVTGYPLRFTRDADGGEHRDGDPGPRRLELEPERPAGSFRQRAAPTPGGDRPGRQAFVAAGFLFTRGCFAVDVAYDPDIYFAGEEITLAVRAYTHGYDLWYPNDNVAWHWYNHPSPLHWDDHDDHAALATAGRHRVRRVLAGDPSLGRFGLGHRRSIASWEHLAGIRVSDAVA
jgi:hypothetical protein